MAILPLAGCVSTAAHVAATARPRSMRPNSSARSRPIPATIREAKVVGETHGSDADAGDYLNSRTKLSR